MTESVFPETRELLDFWTGSLSPGSQVSVRWRGVPVFEHAAGDDGLGRPVRVRTLFKVYCSIKPITAVAIAQLVGAGRLRIDAPLRGVLPALRLVADERLTLRAVLEHTAGLRRPPALTMEMLPERMRRGVLDALLPPRTWSVGVDAAYSEYTGWHVLGRVIEACIAGPLGPWLRAAVLDPLGLRDTWIGMPAHEHALRWRRIGVNCGLHTGTPIPMLAERLERVCGDCNPAYGGYTTAADLCSFYAALERQLVLGGSAALPPPEVLGAFCSVSRKARWDEGLRRFCAFGLGFMVELGGHHFGARCSERAFGHSGHIGSSFGFADPAHEIAVGAVFNGVCDEESAFLRRTALVNAIYRDIGLSEPRKDAGVAAGATVLVSDTRGLEPTHGPAARMR